MLSLRNRIHLECVRQQGIVINLSNMKALSFHWCTNATQPNKKLFYSSDCWEWEDREILRQQTWPHAFFRFSSHLSRQETKWSRLSTAKETNWRLVRVIWMHCSTDIFFLAGNGFNTSTVNSRKSTCNYFPMGRALLLPEQNKASIISPLSSETENHYRRIWLNQENF